MKFSYMMMGRIIHEVACASYKAMEYVDSGRGKDGNRGLLAEQTWRC